MRVLYLQELVKTTEIKESFLNLTERNMLISKRNSATYTGHDNLTTNLAALAVKDIEHAKSQIPGWMWFVAVSRFIKHHLL